MPEPLSAKEIIDLHSAGPQKGPIAGSQIALRLRAVAHAVAQQELEGLKVSPATLEDMRRAARGEISDDDVIANIYARFERA